MKPILFCLVVICITTSCKLGNSKIEDNIDFANLLQKYYNDKMQLFPLEATANGDNQYNNLLPADFTDSYRGQLKFFYARYQTDLQAFDREKLNENDKTSYDIFSYELKMGIEGISQHHLGSTVLSDNSYMPFDQFNGVTLTLGQMGGGTGLQPFKTVKDYENWIQRATAFSAWADSAIVYFRKGIADNYTLPKTLVVKMIPQLQAMISNDAKSSLFYGPVKLMPATFSEADKKRLTTAYVDLINKEIVPSYKKLAVFLQTEYLPKARTTTGINALPGGDKYYAYLVKYWTTTSKTPDEIYKTGLDEVKRIAGEMEKVKVQVHFNGDMKAFFTFMKTDKQFMPYKTPEEVLNAFRSIYARIQPKLKDMYGRVPKSKFEIRQTEAFRAASASAEYYPGLADGSRPGIFYIPILDAKTFNTTSGMESLFLHEAIPGHHYQISLQMENEKLPDFRKYIWYGAYGEGYALYCESMGKELGLYTDP
ncbi:MAG TPA: DUF885 domain-containing protein, partial [Sphingobacteriaceae bacterium]|nr:DUF885 domain-containing protein [Sphingobacteriaceae bacterium]